MIFFWLMVMSLLLLVFFPLARRWTDSKFNRLILLGLGILSFGLYIYLGASKQLSEYAQITKQAQAVKSQLGEVKSREVIISQIQKNLAEHPQDAEGWFLLGRLHMSLGHQNAAMKAYQKAHEIIPDNQNMSVMYLQSARMAKAQLNQSDRLLLEQLLSNHPDNPDILNLAAMTAYKDHQRVRANMLWRRALPHLLPGSKAYQDVEAMIKLATGAKDRR